MRVLQHAHTTAVWQAFPSSASWCCSTPPPKHWQRLRGARQACPPGTLGAFAPRLAGASLPPHAAARRREGAPIPAVLLPPSASLPSTNHSRKQRPRGRRGARAVAAGAGDLWTLLLDAPSPAFRDRHLALPFPHAHAVVCASAVPFRLPGVQSPKLPCPLPVLPGAGRLGVPCPVQHEARFLCNKHFCDALLFGSAGGHVMRLQGRPRPCVWRPAASSRSATPLRGRGRNCVTAVHETSNTHQPGGKPYRLCDRACCILSYLARLCPAQRLPRSVIDRDGRAQPGPVWAVWTGV